MAIAITDFDSNADTTGGNPVLLTSKTYTAGRLYLFLFQVTGATNVVPTLAGLAFTEIGRDSTGSNASIVIAFYATVASTTTGQVSVACAGGASGLEYDTLEITGHNNTTPVWLGNVATSHGTLAIAFSVTLPNALLSASDVVVAIAGVNQNTSSLTKGTGWTKGTNLDYATPVAGALAEWKINDNNPNYTWSPGNTAWAEVAFEVLASGVTIPGAALAGTTAGTGVLSGALTTSIRLAGTTAGAGALTGALTTGIPLAGTIAGTGAASGDVTVPKPVAGTITGVAALSAALTVTPGFQGTSAGTGALTGALTTGIPLAGAIAGVGTLAAPLTTGALLVGTIAGAGALAGRLQTDFAGTIAGTGALAADVTIAKPLAGSVVGTGAATGALTTGIPVLGTIAGTGALAGALTTAIRLAGTIAGSATLSAPLRTGAGFSGSIVGHALLLGRLYDVGAGTPLEVDVYDGATGLMLATLEGARGRSYLDPLSDLGSFTFAVRVSDPKAGYVVRGNIVKFRLHGQYRFAAVIESPETVAAAVNGIADEVITARGRGATALLDWAKQAPGAGGYGSVPAAAVLAAAIDAAKARGLLGALSYDFTDEVDSAGLPWTDAAPYTVKDGDSYLNIWRLLTAVGIETRVDPDTMTLQAYRDGIGSDLSAGVVLEQARHVRANVSRPADDTQYFSRVWVKGSGGTVVQRFGDETDHRRAPRDGYVEVSSTDDPATLAQAGDIALAEAANIARALHVPMLHGLNPGELEPYLDFGNGDTFPVNLDGIAFESSRVRAITVAADRNDGLYDVDVDFNAVALEGIARLKINLDALAAKVAS